MPIVHHVYCWRGDHLVDRFVIPQPLMEGAIRYRLVETDWTFRGHPVVPYLTLSPSVAARLARLASAELTGDAWTLELSRAD